MSFNSVGILLGGPETSQRVYKQVRVLKTELRHMHHRYRGYPSCINWTSLIPAASTGAGWLRC